jgi:hypothetical protein
MVVLAGCTVVEITDSQGTTRIERRAGIASIIIQPNADAVVARVRAFGLASTPFGFTAGYAAQQFAMLGKDCRVVFWVEAAEHLTALDDLAAVLDDICVINPNRGNEQ